MASHLTMMEVQLTSISPSHLESHHSLATSPVHLATSPVHPGPIPVLGSPVHAAGQRILVTSDLSSAYMLTSLPLAHPSAANGSPFASPSTSPPFLSASPTNSMGSAVSSPLNIPASPSHSHSMSASLLTGHRPVGPSQSVDSFFTPNISHSLPSTLMHSAAHFSPQHVVLPSVSESGRSSENISNVYSSSPADSLVTVRSTSRPSTSRNRHSYTNGDASVFNFVPANLHLPLHVPRQRRNSSGSQDLNSTRTRRSSHSSVMSPSASLDSAFLASHRRGRRRSHDAYVDSDIVANFGPLAVSQRRTSRSSSREPYNV